MRLILHYFPVYEKERTYFLEQILNGSKKHTIRKPKYGKLPFPVDVEHRYADDVWNPVNGIITGTQDIEIIYADEDTDFYRQNGYSPVVIVDGNILTEDEAMELAINDGFRSWNSFRTWFDDDFTGVILHFTNMRYE